MTEKYVLREVAKPYIPESVYTRQKHPFLAPPALLDPKQKLGQLMQDTLRGNALAAIPFIDQASVIAFLDGLADLPVEMQAASEGPLMELMSLCALHHHFRPGA